MVSLLIGEISNFNHRPRMFHKKTKVFYTTQMFKVFGGIFLKLHYFDTKLYIASAARMEYLSVEISIYCGIWFF